MKKLWIAAVAAGWAWAAQAGMGIVWSTCGWFVEAGGDANAGPGIAENNVVTWQLVYAGANNAPDAINPSAAGWTGGDDVLLAERVVPAGGGTAAAGTSWDSFLMQQGGNTTYEDPTWPADRGGFVFQRVFQGAPSEGTPYAESGLFAFDPAFAGNGAPPDLFYFPADGYGLVLDRAVTPPPPVPYLDPTTHSTNTCDTYTPYTGQTTLTSGWYVVTGDITNDTRIAVSGDVHIILADGCTLSTGGVKAAPGGSLTIWGQTEGSGTLIADGRITWYPGIECTDASVTVNGGTVNATGNQWTAGIGGYFEEFSGSGPWSIGDPTPYPGGTVTINGGTVNATGGQGAAGIGGSLLGAGGPVTITGGTVVARAGDHSDWYNDQATAQAIGRGQGSADSGDLIIPGMKVYASEDATEPVAAGDRMDACHSPRAKLAPCAPHAVASCQWCGMKSFLVRKLFDGEHHGTNTYSTVELTVYSAAAANPDARGACLTYVIEGDGIDRTDNLDENGKRRTLDGIYDDIEQAHHFIATFDDKGWAYIKAGLKENSAIRVTGEFGPYDPAYAQQAPNGMDRRMTLSTTGLLQGQTFYVIERDPGYFYAGPTGYVYTGDDEAADPRVDTTGMTQTDPLDADIPDETDYPPTEYDNNPGAYTRATIPARALFLKDVATSDPTTVFVVNITEEDRFTDMAARVTDYDMPYDGQGHKLGVTMSGNEVDDWDWTGRYALGDSTGPTNDWSSVKPYFTNVCDVTVWVETTLEGWSGTTSGVVRITSAPLAITAKDQACDFDGQPHGEDGATYTDPADIAAKVEVSGLVPGDGLASVTLDGTRTAPGTGPIIPSGVVVTNATGDVTFNYAVSYTNGTLTILGPPPEVTDVTAAPTGGSWQGQVDIFFNVTNDVAAGLTARNRPVLVVTATDNETGSNYVAAASALSGDTDASPLAHSVTWDLRSQGIRLSSASVTFRVAYVEWPKPYCVIDLSGGPSASRYPVSYVSEASEVPGGAPTADDCRRTNLVLRLVEPGSFLMGNGRSARQVTLTRPFYMGVFETTQTQWTKVMDYNTSDHFGFTFPMEYVSWNSIRGSSDAFNWPSVTGVGDDSFMGKLRARTGLEVDLPTEAQWEYACRAGTTGDYAGTGILDEMGFYLGNGGNRNCTATVGSYQPNGWGLYDMHGNVAEWCLDWAGTPPGGTDPVGPQSGTWRVKRGGSYEKSADDCTSHSRDSMYPHLGKGETGFRVCQTVQDAGAVICSGAGASIAVDPAFAVTVVGGSTTNSPATAGTTVTVAADEPDPGKAFVQWTGDDGVVFADASAAETTFAMPATNVTVTANFRELPTVSNVIATAHEPWDGGIGISFNLSGQMPAAAPAWNTPRLVVTATDNETGSNYVAAVSALSGDLDAASGDHTVTWDLAAQGIEFASGDVTFSVAYRMVAVPGDWCVIDLSGGTGNGHPVTYLDAEPEGGFTNDLYRTTNLVMRLVAPGTFTMGDAGMGDNAPHEVTLTRPFYCAVFETTQRQWELVTGTRPSYFNNDAWYATRPVEQVSYDMVRGASEGAGWPGTGAVDDDSFLGVLRRRTGLDTLDLPTEAQWEYACRAGTTTDFNNGQSLSGWNYGELHGIGRHFNNGGEYGEGNPSCGVGNGTATAGSYAPNAWGLYDMHGNVREWCLDWYARDISCNATNPVGFADGVRRVVRGGSWIDDQPHCTSASKSYLRPSDDESYNGVRLAMTLPEAGDTTICAGSGAPIALAPPARYPLWVGGRQVTDNNKGDILGNGSARYEGDASGGTLTLAGADISGAYEYRPPFTAAIYAGAGLELTLSVSGSNRVSNATEFGIGDAVRADGDLTVAGGGILVAEAASEAVAAGGRLVIDGTVVSPHGELAGLAAGGGIIVSNVAVTTLGGPLGIGATSDGFGIGGTNELTGWKFEWTGFKMEKTFFYQVVPNPDDVNHPDEFLLELYDTPYAELVEQIQATATTDGVRSGYEQACAHLVATSGKLAADGVSFRNSLADVAVEFCAAACLTVPVAVYNCSTRNEDYLLQCCGEVGFRTTQAGAALARSRVPSISDSKAETAFDGSVTFGHVLFAGGGPVRFVGHRPLSVSGDGSLVAEGGRDGIYTADTLRIDHFTATATGVEQGLWASNMVIEASALVVVSEGGDAIHASGDIEIAGGTLNVTNLVAGIGICADGTLSVTGGTVTARAASNAIQSAGSIAITGAEIDAEGSGGIRSGSSIAIDGAVVTAKGTGGEGIASASGGITMTGERTVVTADGVIAGSDLHGALYADGPSGTIALEDGLRIREPVGGSIDGSGRFVADEGGDVAGHVVIRAFARFADDDIRLTAYSDAYDGEGHTIGIETNAAIAGLVLRYAGTGGRFVETSLPEYVNVTNARVWVEASAPGYITATNSATVRITPRAVTVTAKSEEFTYDGQTHGNALYEVEGLVGNDAISAVVTGAITFPRESPATNVVTNYEFIRGLAGNYSVATRNGELTMANATEAITIAAASGQWTYDGEAHTNGTVAVTHGALLDGDALSASATGSVTNVSDTATGNNPVSPGYKVMHGAEDVTANYVITPVAGTLSILPRAANFAGQSETKVFTGSEIVITNLVVSNLVNGHTHDATFSASGTDVGGPYEGTITPANDVRITDGAADVTANYAVTVLNGALTIVQDPALAFTVSLADGTFNYDGQPHALETNATHTAASGATAVEYSKDGASWTNELSSLTATNVADSCAILVRATNPNYANPATNAAALVIAPRDIANATVAAIGTQYYEGLPLTPPLSVQCGGRALDEGVDYDASYTNNAAPGTATVTLTGRSNYTNQVSTTFQIVPATLAFTVTAGKWGAVVVETNGVGLATVGPDATTNLVVGYGAGVAATAVPNDGFDILGGTNSVSFPAFTNDASAAFAFLPNPADATIRWKFSSAVGRHFAQVAIPSHAGYAEALGGLAFLFADRTNDAGTVYAQLWNAAARAPESVLVTDGGVEHRGVALPVAAFDGLADGECAFWGVSDETFADARTIVPAGERRIGLYVRKRVSPVSGNETAGEVESFLGHLTWTTEGTRWFLPIVDGAANGSAATATRRSAAAAPAPGRFSVSRRAYAPATLGLSVALGLDAAAVAEEAPTARIAAFEVGADGSVRGRIEAAAGGEASSSFGGTATVLVLSSESPDGPWTEEASAEVDSTTGAFALPPGGVDPDARFFKALIETREIYE